MAGLGAINLHLHLLSRRLWPKGQKARFPANFPEGKFCDTL
jgi:hypothetical protein